jgi:hypothetical protein
MSWCQTHWPPNLVIIPEREKGQPHRKVRPRYTNILKDNKEITDKFRQLT